MEFDMKQQKTGLSVAVAFGLEATMALAQGTQTADQQAVQTVIDRMMNAFAAGDVPGILQTYRSDAVVMGSPDGPVSGHAALTAMFDGFVATGFSFLPGGHEVIVSGDTALHLMDWQGQGPDGDPFSALSVAVLTRDAEGEWRMVIDHPFGDGLLRQP